MKMSDTIFAPTCPIGGSVVTVRFSGKDAFDVLDFFKIPNKTYLKKDLFFAKLICKKNDECKKNDNCCCDNDEFKKNNNKYAKNFDKYTYKTLDEVVVKIFREPHSFTGENIVEIDLHASYIILQELLKLVSTIPNFRFAKNGEFSQRAFLNKKMNLIKCEGINAIIKSETKQQMRLADAMFCGDIYSKYSKIREKILQAMSLIEVSIDFSEEEIPQNVISDVENIVSDITNLISQSLKDKNAIDKINSGVNVALIGDTNVGKSSLINWLAKRKVAIVSPIAGTTRDVISTDIDLNGYKVHFYDTAGIRKTNDLIEQEGVEMAKNVAKNADICIIIFDLDDLIKNKTKQQFADEIEKYTKQYDDIIFVLNKIDLVKKKAVDDFVSLIMQSNNKDIVALSITKEQNLQKLIDEINKKIAKIVVLREEPLVVNERHVFLLEQCLSSLSKIDIKSMSVEIISEELRFAANAIGQITGQIYTEDVLDNIFGKFCIGK